MKELYDSGYQEVRSFDLFRGVVLSLDAVVFDVRFSPRSMNPVWSGSNLVKNLGTHYLWVKALGNIHYKSAAPVEFVDLSFGLLQVAHYLKEHPVILLCACADRQTCHRTLAVQEFQQAYDLASIPLTLAKCRTLMGMEPPTQQLALF